MIFSNCPPTFAPFCPFWGKLAFFQKSDNIILNVLWYSIIMQKLIKNDWMVKKLRVIWKIERSDWSRAFTYKSREREFSQKWGMRRKLANHNMLHFRSFLAKTNDSILLKSPKSPFLPILDPFLGKWEFSRKIRLCHFSTFMVP